MKKGKTSNRDIDKIRKAKTPKKLFAIIEDETSLFYEVSYLKIFVLDDSETAYILKKNVTRTKDTSVAKGDIELALEDPIIAHLLDTRRAILTKEVDKSLIVALIENRRIFLSSLKNELAELRAEVCVPGFTKDKLVTVFILGEKLSKEEFSVEEIELFSSLVEHSAKVIYNFSLLKKEIELFVESIRKINNAMEAKDPYTRGHSDRVAQFSVIVGRILHDEVERIPYGGISLYYAAELHDVGKINLSDSVLKKENALTDEEYNEVKKHPYDSSKILNPMGKWFGKTILDAVLYHHENYDGTGYPYGKKGDEVNILSRIIRVSDSFDAMITDRPYRKALVHHKALSELKKGRGTQFDPEVIDAFLKAYREGLFRDIFFSQLEREEQAE